MDRRIGPPRFAISSFIRGLLTAADAAAARAALGAAAVEPLVFAAGDLVLIVGSPAQAGAGTNFGRVPCWVMDAASDEGVGMTFVVPQGWATADVYVRWINTTTSTGDVVWRLHTQQGAAGAVINNVSVTETGVTGTAGGTVGAAPVRTLVKAGLALTPGNLVRLVVERNAGAVADTLANDAGLIQIELVKAS